VTEPPRKQRVVKPPSNETMETRAQLEKVRFEAGAAEKHPALKATGQVKKDGSQTLKRFTCCYCGVGSAQHDCTCCTTALGRQVGLHRANAQCKWPCWERFHDRKYEQFVYLTARPRSAHVRDPDVEKLLAVTRKRNKGEKGLKHGAKPGDEPIDTKGHDKLRKASLFTGVNWSIPKQKWRAMAYDKQTHKRIHIGYFTEDREAALAHKEWTDKHQPSPADATAAKQAKAAGSKSKAQSKGKGTKSGKRAKSTSQPAAKKTRR
jgi:hypothetical protein